MHFPVLIKDLAVILGTGAIVTFIFRLIKQPVVLGYIVAGIIVGPYTPMILSVEDTDSIKIWAELGVIFLMFALGLEFSFRRLARVGMSAGITATIQICTMLTAGLVTANFLGWGRMDAIFLGCMISISSTTIIIKALEELGLKTKKFSELVFGILIVEDLAAILMLVALTNIATTSEIGGVALLMAGGKLAIVVGAWVLLGIFLVPRFVGMVSRHGNDEMLTVVAMGLCLALVALAAFFHYSVALGAFIMGSILAESSEAKRIEHLIQPVKDIFGAVFFVSVGMLLNPAAIVENIGAIATISTVIVLGMMLSVTFGSLVTGQTIRNSVRTGFSMAQVGEFSFIIGSLGLTYGVISERLYPIIVASSLITTFTTPYLIKAATGVAKSIEGWLPANVKMTHENYISWLQRRSVASSYRKAFYNSSMKWALNAIVIITVFTIGADRLVPVVSEYFDQRYVAYAMAWLLAFTLSAPSIWAMLSTFRSLPTTDEHRRTFPKGGTLLISRVITVSLVGLLSMAYLPTFITLTITLVVCGVVLTIFRKQIEGYYQWMEQQFRSGFQADLAIPVEKGQTFDHLAPWDAYLVELTVPARSFLVGKSLVDLKLRETYGINIVVVVRDGENIVSPQADKVLYPGDSILCFATDAEMERFKDDVEDNQILSSPGREVDTYEIKCLRVQSRSQIKGVSIQKSGIREKFGCTVVGLERGVQRFRSPSSEMPLEIDDVLWIVGQRENLLSLEEVFSPR